MTQRELTFDEPAVGKATCLQHVRAIMLDGKWRSIFEIRELLLERGVMASETSVSARLRDLRKTKCGCLTVHTEKLAPGRVRYRVE